MTLIQFFRSSIVWGCLAGTLWGGEFNWPRWRGPEGTGHTQETGLPVTWSAKDVTYRVELEGWGQSAPMVWGDRIFLTSSSPNGKDRVVLCHDRNTGKQLWKKAVWAGDGESLHKMNSWATPSCVTDGKIVVAFFGRGGIHALDMDGKLLWSHELGAFAGPWGIAASPVIVGDLVVQNCDAEETAFIVAFDKTTGKEAWRTPRDVNRGWSTPIVVPVADHQELVVNGHSGVKSYDPASGKELWFCKSFNGRGSPTVTTAQGLVFAVNGLAGDVYAIRPGGSGNVTASHMAWHTPRRKGRDLPSPIVVDNVLFVVSMTGVATGYDPLQGTEMWNGRLAGNFSGSPVAASGLIYVQNEAGTVYVIKPLRDQLQVEAENKLGDVGDEIFRASPAMSEGQFFFRSDKALYCVGIRKK